LSPVGAVGSHRDDHGDADPVDDDAGDAVEQDEFLCEDSDRVRQAVEREEKAVEESEEAAVPSHLPAAHALVVPV